MVLTPGFVEAINTLKRKLPKYIDELEWISQLASTTRAFEYSDFFEPKTWLFKDLDSEPRFQISPDLLAAWICHLSHGSRRRMELYEDEVLAALSNDRFLIAATLARCHIEASAWVVYGLEELTKAAEKSDWAKLETLIPKMLSGAAVTKEAGYLPEESIDSRWVEPSSIMNAIDALDRYFRVCTGHKSHDARVLYAVLSDYAHPSIFGAKHLFQAKEQDDSGWTISYGRAPTLTENESGMVLRALLVSMRLGHSAAIMLRLGTIEERGDTVCYLKPSPSDAVGVWEQIINRGPQNPSTDASANI